MTSGTGARSLQDDVEIQCVLSCHDCRWGGGYFSVLALESISIAILSSPRDIKQSHRALIYLFIFLQALDEDVTTSGKLNQWHSRPVSDWSAQQVCQWLIGMNMEQYITEFTAKNIDGQQLMLLDSDRLKVRSTILCVRTNRTWNISRTETICFVKYYFFKGNYNNL